MFLSAVGAWKEYKGRTNFYRQTKTTGAAMTTSTRIFKRWAAIIYVVAPRCFLARRTTFTSLRQWWWPIYCLI